MRGHTRVRALLREPLLHFLLIGGALFGVDALRPSELENERRIVVSELLREELAESWAGAHGRPPDAERIERLTDAWIDEEVLYREGLARGFGRDDPAVRARVASQMAFVLREQVVVPEPTEQEVRAWWAEHRDRWARGARVGFTHVFVEGDDELAQARARELLQLLGGGASPARLGDRFPGGRRYRQRELSDLSLTFGESFARGLADQPLESWAMRSSRYGLHLVRVEARTAAQTPELEAVRAEVREAMVDERREHLLAARIAALRARFRVERAP